MLVLRATIGKATPCIKSYVDFNKNFVYKPHNKYQIKVCWGKNVDKSLTELTTLPKDCPLQCFTLSCYEYLRCAAQKFDGKKFNEAAAPRLITLQLVKDTATFIRSSEPTHIHSTYGDFSRPVHFILNTK